MRELFCDVAPRIAVSVLAGLVLAGCATSGSDTTSYNQPGEIRNTTDTAPADLQLSCASAVASQFGLAPDTVLPASSSSLGDGTYQVQLMAAGQGYQCTIDENANILGITPV